MTSETSRIEFRAWALPTYIRRSAASRYALGFTLNGSIYVAYVGDAELEQVISVDRASRGAGLSLRFKPTKAQKFFLLKYADVLCSQDLFNTEVSISKYNAGEVFEKMVTESFGQTWVKDNIPFTQAGDINVNGEEIQIKFERASLATERQLIALR